MSDRLSMTTALTINALLLGGLGGLLVLGNLDYASWYDLVQEDGVVEWLTITALLPAAGFCVDMARKWPADRRPWFALGLAAFCIFFAGEEASWGQRLFGYLPPPYFLEHNTQQEANVHNLFKELVRTKYILMAIFVVYGALLPLASLAARPRALMERLGLIVPPVEMIPSMLAGLALLVVYPLKYSGEVAEALFALLLLYMSFLRWRPLRARAPQAVPGLVLLTLVVIATGWLLPQVIGIASSRADVARTEQARLEVGQLLRDWHTQAEADKEPPSGCNTHIRLYTWVRKHDLDRFRTGAFVDGQEDERHTFFLDPWNSPYWIRHRCTGDDKLTIYSFGPNRKRDSSKKMLLGDDIGVFELVDD